MGDLDKAPDSIFSLRARVEELERERTALLARVEKLEAEQDYCKVCGETAVERCTECNVELSACGEMTSEGPRMDCLVCRLRVRIAALERHENRFGWFEHNVDAVFIERGDIRIEVGAESYHGASLLEAIDDGMWD